jgi:hypothetical protein
MTQDMQNESGNIYRALLDYMKESMWMSAMIEANNLAARYPHDKKSVVLAKCLHAIKGIDDRLQTGTKSGDLAKLEKIERILPELSKMNSFQSLKALISKTKAKNAGPHFKKHGFVISFLIAIVIVLLFNTAAYAYNQSQPMVTKSGTDGPFRSWVALQNLDKPVDTLLLGDSSCHYNLAWGAIADRLGGEVLNLGSNIYTSFLSDAYMLAAYIEKFGPPKNVVISRTSSGYATIHQVEFVVNVPLPWAYWDYYQLPPSWKKGETLEAFIDKFCVLYSYADILQERLLEPWTLFDHAVVPRVTPHTYSSGDSSPQLEMDVATRTPDYYFKNFYASDDTVASVKYMSDLARQYHFQLYFVLQPEWKKAVEAGLRDEMLAEQREFLSEYTDPTYVHIVEQSSQTLFTKDQLHNPNHLRPAASAIYTEEVVNVIIDIQNELTGSQAQLLELTSFSLDKEIYQTEQEPVLTLKIANRGVSDITGSVSCLIKPSGAEDAYWVARAPGVAINIAANGELEITLNVTEGELIESGEYELVVFIRQDIGGLSYETRIVVSSKIIVG